MNFIRKKQGKKVAENIFEYFKIEKTEVIR